MTLKTRAIHQADRTDGDSWPKSREDVVLFVRAYREFHGEWPNGQHVAAETGWTGDAYAAFLGDLEGGGDA